ncbi:MAG TPA: hypothetical protein P5137_09190 [Candidatus Brocadiia bacterium]|nr:hypothetical protein [Candidatus Brocadiia bacterium]
MASRGTETAPDMGVVNGADNALTWRTFGVGLALSFFLGALAVHSVSIQSSDLAQDYSLSGAIVLFLAVVAGLNPLLKLTSRRPWLAGGVCALAVLGLVFGQRGALGWGFSTSIVQTLLALAAAGFAVQTLGGLTGFSLAMGRGELIAVYVMLLCAGAVSAIGFTTTVIPSILAVTYYASPENRWERLFGGRVPAWVAPRDPGVAKRFYDGVAGGPWQDWDAWLWPVVSWTGLTLALSVVMIAAMTLLRKQWVERERLAYPMAHLPLAMVEQRPAQGKGFWDNWLMWLGFAAPVVVTSLNGLAAYFQSVPRINLSGSTTLFHDSLLIRFNLSFVMVGFAYLIRKDLALSLWVFALMAVAARGVLKHLGAESAEDLLYGTNRGALLSHLGMGAMIVFVACGLWSARRGLWDALRKAVGRAPDVDDSGEVMSYSAAVWLGLAGLAAVEAWLVAVGVPWWAGLLILAAAMILFLGMTRIVSEVGLSNAVGPMSAPCVVTSTVGANAFSADALAALGPTFLWAGAARVSVMASAAHGLRLLDETSGRKRRAFLAMLLSIVAASVGGIWMLLSNAYGMGAVNFGYPYLTDFAKAPWQYVSRLMLTTPGPQVAGLWHTGIGAAMMAALMFLRNRFLWWPLAPAGFPLAGIWLMDRLWFSVFLAWLVKGLLLRYGGPKVFQAFRPMFLGFVLGQFFAAGLWLAIDTFTGMQGNRVFWI